MLLEVVHHALPLALGDERVRHHVREARERQQLSGLPARNSASDSFSVWKK